MVTRADAAAVVAAIGAWLAGQATARQSSKPKSAAAGESDRASALVAIAVDGKTERGVHHWPVLELISADGSDRALR